MQGKTVKVCAACGAHEKELLKCSRCKQVYYCNSDCQKNDFPTHKLTCSKPTDSKPPYQTYLSGINDFKLYHLGNGNFSTIYKATSHKTGKVCAIKQVEKSTLKRLRKEADLFMEKHCLKKMTYCPYVVQLYQTFQDSLFLFVQMEFVEKGELWEVAKNFGIVSEQLYKYYAAHIVKAVWVVHEKYTIVHRDLKPENILISESNYLKLIDFGTAKDLERPDIKGAGNGLKGRYPFEHYVGTPNYMAPYCIHNKASDKISDVYSLSGVLYFLKVGSPPFAGGSYYLIFKKSLETELFMCEYLFDIQLKDLISKMNVKTMEDRISLREVMKHPYFADVDFENLPTYYESAAKQTEFELAIVEHCTHLDKLVKDSAKKTLDYRKALFMDTLSPYLYNMEKQLQTKFAVYLVSNRVLVLRVQLLTLLNLYGNNNEGFTECYKAVKNIKDVETMYTKELNAFHKAQYILGKEGDAEAEDRYR